MHFATKAFCVCVSVSVRVCVGVMKRRYRCSAKNTLVSATEGILAQRGHQMSEQCRNLPAGPVTLFLTDNGIKASRNKL